MIATQLTLKLGDLLRGPYYVFGATLPDDPPLPYLTVQLLSLHHATKKHQALVEITGWSRAEEPTQIQEVAEHVRTTLLDRLISLDELGKASCRLVGEKVTLLNDRKTRRYDAKLKIGIRP